MGKAANGAPARGAGRYWLASFFGISLVVLIAAALLLRLWSERDVTDSRDRLAAEAWVFAQTLVGELSWIHRLLEAWRAAPGLSSALESKDPAALRRAEQSLAGQLPGASAIHLLPIERVESSEGIPFLSFAGIELARQAARDQSVTPFEANKVGQPDMHLAVAAPVTGGMDGRVIGVVHLELPMSLLPSPSASTGGRGTLRYQQVVGRDAVTLGSKDPLPVGEPDELIPVEGTRLRVAAWLAPSAPLDPALIGVAAAACLLVLLLIGLVLWLGQRALRRALADDCTGLVALTEDAVESRPMRKLRCNLAETEQAEQAMAALLGTLAAPHPAGAVGRRPQRAQLRRASGLAPGDEDELTGMPDDSSYEVDELELPDLGRLKSASAAAIPAATDTGSSAAAPLPPPEIFRAYDIRGVVDRQIRVETMHAIGRAIASEAAARGDRTVNVGRDCRATSPLLAEALIKGIRAAGADVVDLGVVPTPVLYFACCHPEQGSGAVVTASHNPPQYNGVKVVYHGESTDAAGIQGLRERIAHADFTSGSGAYRGRDLIPDYLEYVEREVALARGLKLAIDCGNGAASLVAPGLFRALGCEVLELNCDVEAGMGERLLDPARPEHTRDLGDLVRAQGADIGLAFDGDGDRLGVVDSEGRFVAADRVLMLLAADVLARHPGSDVVFDVKCSRHLADEIRRNGGRPLMWRSGHGQLKAKLRETGAPIAGELTGHIIFGERWFGFDDALYAGARLLEVLALDPRPTGEIFDALPHAIATPELGAPLAEGESARVMDRVLRFAERLEGVEVVRIDGLRAEFERGWGLVRASNTEPKLVFRFEGDDQEALEKIQDLFRRLMARAAPEIQLPF